MATDNELRTINRKKQSPIDILDKIVRNVYLPRLTLKGHWFDDGQAILKNDGKNAVVTLTGGRIPSIITSGPLTDEYEFYDLTFFWGQDDCNGSEHTINGSWFSMEAHAVHWNQKYRTFDECLKYEDGLCTLVYLFLTKDCTEDCTSCVKLEKITDNLEKVIRKGSQTTIAPNSLCWMRMVRCCNYYYFYKGSYNKDDFPECALWIIFPNYIPIGADQVEAFRRLRDEKGREIKTNRRKTQHLNDRKIYKAIC